MSNQEKELLDGKILTDGEYIQLCEEVCNTVRFYAYCENDKKLVQEACNFSITLLQILKGHVIPIFDKARVKNAFKKAEIVLFYSDDYIFSGEHASMNNLYKKMPLVVRHFKLLALELCDFSCLDVNNNKSKGAGYRQIAMRLRKLFEELSIRPY